MQSKELHAMTDDERSRLQAHLRGMYLEIEKVCDRHNLRVCLGCGNALGALRHKGFIPWDDDLDLLMPRKDYDKLINEYAKELPVQYKIYAPNSQNGPIYRFAKVVDTNTRFLGPGVPDNECHGVFVDIFPLENTTTNLFVIKCNRICLMALMVIASSVAQYKSKNVFYRNLMCSTSKGCLTYYIRNTVGFLFGFFSAKRWYNIFDDFSKGHKETGFVNMPSNEAGLWKYFNPYSISMYFPAKKVMYDDIMAYVPNNAEKYLEIEFGDWHWIPPMEDRWQHFVKKIKL